MNNITIIMGVSGCGKTTVGKLLASKLGIPFYDADDFHSDINKTKMSNQNPLTDYDRIPWLDSLSNHLKEWQLKDGAVLACSALKEDYRVILASKTKAINWVVLLGDYNTIKLRLDQRQNHFMKASLLQSQFDSLEIPEYGLQLSVKNEPETIANKIIKSFYGQE